MTDAASRAAANAEAVRKAGERAREEMQAKAQHHRGQTPRSGKR
jgi:hypothetical protein